MIDKVINGMIAGIVGAVAFVAIKSLVSGNIYGPTGKGAYEMAGNASNSSAGELMIHDILPLAIAIMVIAGLFMGLTRIRGV